MLTAGTVLTPQLAIIGPYLMGDTLAGALSVDSGEPAAWLPWQLVALNSSQLSAFSLFLSSLVVFVASPSVVSDPAALWNLPVTCLLLLSLLLLLDTLRRILSDHSYLLPRYNSGIRRQCLAMTVLDSIHWIFPHHSP